MNKIEKAWIPPESEKKSIERPSKKLYNKNGNLFSFRGYKKTKTIYKYGFINPKNKMLFSTKTCKKSSKKNNVTMFNGLFILSF